MSAIFCVDSWIFRIFLGYIWIYLNICIVYHTNMALRNKKLQQRIREIQQFIEEQYKPTHVPKARNFGVYEQEWQARLQHAITSLNPLVTQACATITTHKGPGPKRILDLRQRLLILLLQRWCDQSNRMMSSLLLLFSTLNKIQLGYKSIERLYSDQEVQLALHNLHVLILQRQHVKVVDTCGDATGYALTISKHYATHACQLKEKAKTQDGIKKFVYVFRLLDLKTRLYLAYGTSFKSEKEAFDQAIRMLRTLKIQVRSIRLDRYYSNPCYIDQFPDTKVYLIPKKNATLKHSGAWKKMLIEFYNNQMQFLEEYFQRNTSENEFGNDKKHFGWGLPQRRDDRIDTAAFATTELHNLLHLTTPTT